MRLDTFGSSRDIREHRGHGLWQPSLQNSMLIQFFDYFMLNYRNFSQISCVFHVFGSIWELQRDKETKRGWAMTAIPPKQVCSYVCSIFWLVTNPPISSTASKPLASALWPAPSSNPGKMLISRLQLSPASTTTLQPSGHHHHLPTTEMSICACFCGCDCSLAFSASSRPLATALWPLPPPCNPRTEPSCSFLGCDHHLASPLIYCTTCCIIYSSIYDFKYPLCVIWRKKW